MARDVKLLQHGVNVQANDLAVAPGTPVRALNIDYQRDGVAARRAGFDAFYAGLPWSELDPFHGLVGTSTTNVTATEVKGIFELFSRDRPMIVHGGFVFAYDEAQARWECVPVELSHRLTFFGNFGQLVCNTGVGRAIRASFAQAAVSRSSPFCMQSASGSEWFVGTPGNAASDQRVSGAAGTTLARMSLPADAVDLLVTDGNVIWRTDRMDSVFAGSLTSSGSVDGTGTAAKFSGASWMVYPYSVGGGTSYFVVDNTNQIRQVTTGGVVTTFAGSITAGSTDAVGTAARFTNLSGLATDNAQFLYALEATGAGRVRKIDIISGSVTTINSAVGASFGAGLEYVAGNLYAGGNNGTIKQITPAGVVTTYCGNASLSYNDFAGSTFSTCSLPNAVVRGQFTPGGSSTTFLVVECRSNSDATMMDVVLVPVTTNAGEQSVYHIARCPFSYPNGTTGPNKMDSWGPNTFAIATARGVDLGSGVAFTASERPLAIDIWTAQNANDPQPKLRPLGLNPPEAPTVSNVAGTTFAAATSVAYRVVNGLKLPDGRITLGPPSERIILIGSATATWQGSITAYPSPGLTYDGLPFLQLYRTKAAASTLDPGDQMFLAYETALTYSAGVAISDILPDELLGAELYTNVTEDGIAGTALAPPLYANDLVAFDKSAVMANYVRPATLTIKVLGTSPLVAGTSTLTLTANCVYPFNELTAHFPIITGGYQVTLTAIAGVTAPASNQFQIASGGTSAQNAVQTARNIVSCINRSPDCFLFRAQYDESSPGSIIVTGLFPGLSKDVVGAVRTSNLNAALTTTQSSVTLTTNASAAILSTNSNVATRDANAVAYSDQLAYDSFPATNETTAGNATESILRLLPISDTLLAVKDDSVWRTDNAFQFTIYDKALSCQLPESFALVNNQWIGAFTRGFVSLSAAQGIALGRPIDRDVTSQYFSYASGFTADFAFGAGIDLSGNYLCAFNGRAFAFNNVSQCWSEWAINTMAAQGVADAGFQVVGAFRESFVVAKNGARSVLRQHRWQRDASQRHKDYADATYTFASCTLAADLQTITIGAYDATVNVGALPPAKWAPPAGAVADAANASAGFWWVVQVTKGGTTENAMAVITAASPSSPTSAITIALVQPLTTITAGTVSVVAYAPIVCRVQYAPFVSIGDNAGFGDVLVTQERVQPGWLIARFFNRRDLGDATIEGVGRYSDSYGISRASLMPSLTTPAGGVGSSIAYADAQRFVVPAERANDQVLGLELWEGTAWQPLALKAVTIDRGDRGNLKVTR